MLYICTMKISIDSQKCVSCGRCARVCPVSIFQQERGHAPSVSNESACIKCGHCVDVCSSDAIIHQVFPSDCIYNINTEILPSPKSLLELIRSRRSNRTITNADVPESALNDIIEAARYAPTAENTRRVRVTVLDQKQVRVVEDITMKFFLGLSKVLLFPLIRPLTKLLLPDLYAEAPELKRFEKRWKAGECPCCCNAKKLLVFSAPKGYDFGYQDCNLAYQNASLMAEAHGISQIYMGLVQTACKFLPNATVSKMLDLPKGHKMFALMAIGMPAFRYVRYTRR